MKTTILALVMVASSLAFARSEDQSGYCVISGRDSGGVKITFKGPTVRDGGWFKARRAAYKACNARGYSSCKVDYCRISN